MEYFIEYLQRRQNGQICLHFALKLGLKWGKEGIRTISVIKFIHGIAQHDINSWTAD